MKNIIYYFTGTGNTLKVARDIAASLDDCLLIPINNKGTSIYCKNLKEGSLVCIHRGQKPSFRGFLEVPIR